ncbi:WAT1-related protein At5g40240-like [Pyrus x bretschneideri]|uniref:WAT1-related protein At5g40240-like n=1 Tax=Pyrus x bretschneideri TaxID=225117 RepID=UPI00202DD3B2|nr:WAT1-related protein At5g40240-like [Pyrus x bretschneideri]
MEMEIGCTCMWGVLPFAGMVAMEFVDVGIATISKAAMSRGMSSYVFAVYSNAFATVFLLPFFILQKKPISLPLSFLCRLFLLGLIGSSAMLLAYSGIYYSSPTLSSAISNLSPIFTFILAIIFRMETLDLRRASSQGKLLGTLVSVSGAFVVVLYKGSIILKLKAVSTPDFLHPHLIISEQTMWVCGGLVLTMGCFFGALWNIALTSIVTNYPSKATFAFFYKFFMTIQCTIFSLILERNPNSWVLRPDFEMATIICSAVLGSVFRLGVYSWCVQQKGPIFVSMFKPLGVVIAAFMVVIFLGDALHLGSVIGSLIIAIGFYAMMWAQSKEKSNSMEKEVHSSASATQHAPLLQCRATEDV